MKPKRPVRIATLGDWDHYFSYFLNGTQEGAIRNGCWFRPINIRQNWKRIRKNVIEFRPDIMFCHMLFGKDEEKVRKNLKELRGIRKSLGTRVYYHLGDARVEPRYPHDISESVDACLVNQTGNLKYFSRLWQVPTYYWPYGCFYQEKIAAPVEEFEHGLVFTGRLNDKGIHAPRTRFINDIQKYVGVTVYPSNEYPDTKLLTAEIAASAKAILGVCAGYDIKGYMDVRPMAQYPGAGGLLFQRYYSEMEKVIIPDTHMIVFYDDDPARFYDLYLRWMKKPDKVERIRQEGFKFCQTHHSMYHRVKDVIDITYGVATNTRVFLEDL